MRNVKSFTHTSKQHAVVFLFHRNPHGLPEPVHNALQRLIYDILYGGGKKMQQILTLHWDNRRKEVMLHTDSYKDTAQAG